MAGVEWNSLPWAKGSEVLASGSDWVAVLKPEGVLSHPNESEASGRGILDCSWDSEEEEYASPEGVKIGLCHRLDAPTSGILLLAIGDSLEWFRKEFEDGRMRKKYLAVVVGRPRSRRFVWKNRLIRRQSGNRIRMEVVRNTGLEAMTEGRELEFRRTTIPLTLLELFPQTGRTHQIRVQAAANHLPVLGDRNYGDFRANRAFQKGGSSRRLFLHAAELSWKKGGQVTVIRAEVPAEFLKVFP